MLKPFIVVVPQTKIEVQPHRFGPRTGGYKILARFTNAAGYPETAFVDITIDDFWQDRAEKHRIDEFMEQRVNYYVKDIISKISWREPVEQFRGEGPGDYRRASS